MVEPEGRSEEVQGGMRLPEWATKFLNSEPETGMQYQTGDILLQNGTTINDVVFVGCKWVSEVRNRDDIPFSPADIKEIRLTHRKWKFR